jgi:hypothetical protein
VSEFVGDQFASGGSARLVGVLAEENILAGGEGAGAEIPAQRVGLGIGVNAHAGEVCPESGLHLAADPAVQALSTAALLLDGPLDAGMNLVVRCILSRQSDDALDITVSILPLQLQERALRRGERKIGGAIDGRAVDCLGFPQASGSARCFQREALCGYRFEIAVSHDEFLL